MLQIDQGKDSPRSYIVQKSKRNIQAKQPSKRGNQQMVWRIWLVVWTPLKNNIVRVGTMKFSLYGKMKDMFQWYWWRRLIHQPCWFRVLKVLRKSWTSFFNNVIFSEPPSISSICFLPAVIRHSASQIKGSLPRCEPWCWKIYLQNCVIKMGCLCS